MNTNETIDGVSRELLERALKHAYRELDYSLVDEMRVLLDAERCTSCDGSGDLTDLTGEWRGYCVCPIGVALKNKPAAQPQGEPVAWRVTGRGGLTVTPQYPKWAVGERGLTITPLYAEQPAPVAVALPERIDVGGNTND